VAPKAATHTDGTSGGIIATKSMTLNSGEWHYRNSFFESPADFNIGVNKSFNVDPWPDGKYTFFMKDQMGNVIDSLDLCNTTRSGMFKKITYTKTGDYYYTISENVPVNKNGIVYDTNIYYVKVNVNSVPDFNVTRYMIDNVYIIKADKSENKKISEIKPEEWNSHRIVTDEDYKVLFTNSYDQPLSTSTTLEIMKTVDNVKPKEQFEFNLYKGNLTDGTFAKDGASISKKSNNTSDGLVTFSNLNELTYDDVGTHYYMISEENNANYVSSGNIYVKVEVKKTQDGKKLETSVSYYKDPKFKDKINVTGTSKPTINNSSVKFVLKKTDAKESSKTLSGAKFTLKNLTALNEEDNTLAIGDSATTDPVTTDSNGLAKFNNLSKGKSYLLTEETPPTGYDVAGPWLVTIKEGGTIEFKAINFTNNEKTSYKVVGGTSTYNVKTIDSKPAEIGDKKKEYTLPSTGGIGTKKYYLLGMLLSMLGFIYVVIKKIKGGTFKKKEHS